jgi:hypothetical protein
MYLLDSNILTEAKNRYYSFDICPGFWSWLDAESVLGGVASIKRIRAEINDGDDDDPLKLWVAENKLDFLEPDAATVEAMKEVTQWVMAQDYNEANRAGFFAKADPLLIAHAKAHDYTVVTHEKKVPGNSKKVKIPNVCEALDVKCIDTFQMLTAEKAQFNL